ncbi:histone deacetylase 8-like [Aricia agestis]|uniref:histone deacetylase 8-like n=1 Tax=Aricia agestis TaxID=91739 RepID=UPI001C20975C|nr:histone deacetylase 8-like [Aricia agestis]
MSKSKVIYIWEENLIKECDRLPAVLDRASLVHELITAYGLTNRCKIVKSVPATYNELTVFHSELYINHLKTLLDVEDDYIPTAEDEKYGIGYDCQPVSNMYSLVSVVAGSSVTAAKCILMGLCDVVINWCGGWHHSQRFTAEGFCYVNDIVIAIEQLLKKFPKVLYIDLDVHHGNGVQDAYNLSKSVFTLSFHKYEPGFYPGTGGVEEIGTLNGQGYTCNFPLHAAYSDKSFIYAFEKSFALVYDHFKPNVIVVQCGADALANDPQGGGGLTVNGYCTSIQHVLNKKIPTMLLGGGGYNFPNAAKLWTSITALVLGEKLDENIPEHKYWPKYGPDFLLNVRPLLSKDLNSIEYLEECIKTIEGNLRKYLGESLQSNNVKEETGIKQNNNKIKCYMISKESNNPNCEKADVYDFSD